MLQVTRGWALDGNEHVCCLASESSPSRLPCSFQLKQLIKDQSLMAPIFEARRSDRIFVCAQVGG